MLKFMWGSLLVLVMAGSASATDYYRNNVLLKRVEFDSRYYLGQDGYYSVGQKLQQDDCKAENDALKQRTTKLEAQLEILMQLLKNGGTPNNPPVVPPVVPPTEPPTEPPTQPPAEGNDEPTALDAAVFGIFSKSCTKCHSELKKEGDLQLVNTKEGSLVYQDLAERTEIYLRTLGVDLDKMHKAAMPKGGQALNDKDVSTIRLWMGEESDRIRSGK